MIEILVLTAALSVWKDEENGYECRWIQVSTKAFKQCRAKGTTPQYYKLCIMQPLEGMGFHGEQWHHYCSFHGIDIEIEELKAV